LSASAVATVVANTTPALPCQYRLYLFSSPHLQARRHQQRTGAGTPWQVLFGRETLKRSILVHILLNKETSFVAGSFWREQESSRILRNPEESGVNTGIPVPQEFLRKIHLKSGKNRNSCDPSKNTFLRKIPQENTEKKKNPQESCQERFFGSKK
jgi:hypothetical protein